MRAVDVANYLLFVTSEACDDVTNMKINKLVCYAQGHALQKGFTLFSDEIRAGDHGPIVEEVYHEYEPWGDQPIKEWDEERARTMPEEIKEFLVEVAKVYGKYTAGQLRYMTHQPNTPWSKYYQRGGRYRLIPLDEIREHFIHNVSPLEDNEVLDAEFVGYRDEDGYLVLPAYMR